MCFEFCTSCYCIIKIFNKIIKSMQRRYLSTFSLIIVLYICFLGFNFWRRRNCRVLTRKYPYMEWNITLDDYSLDITLLHTRYITYTHTIYITLKIHIELHDFYSIISFHSVITHSCLDQTNK